MFLSKSIENAVSEFSKLPGVGKKTAFRYVLQLIKNEAEKNEELSTAILNLKLNLKNCEICNVSNDNKICDICSNVTRPETQICVVEGLKDLIAVENTHQYHGKYHVLGGVISPIDGIGPNELFIESLEKRIEKLQEPVELIMALNPTIEGDTTVYYLSKKLSKFPVTITTISRGISFGSELDYADELTLGRSIHSRQPYDQLINK